MNLAAVPDGAWAVIGSSLLAVLGGIGWAVRQIVKWWTSRRAGVTAPPAPVDPAAPAAAAEVVERLSLSQATSLVTGISDGWATRVVRLEAKVGKLVEDRAADRRTLDRLSGALVRFVHPLVEWLDAGAHPPPPVVSDELRAVLAELMLAPAPAQPSPAATPDA